MESLRDARFAFVGAGQMAEAMIGGLLSEGSPVEPGQICASHPRPERRDDLAERWGIAVTADNAEVLAGADDVVLCVKPQRLGEVAGELCGLVRPEQTVVSILAGTSFSQLGQGLGHDALVRAMPNTPSRIGRGMTVWTATDAVAEPAAERVRAMLATMGEELRVASEQQINMATALSGTGPTYVFLLMEALVDAGVHLGFSRRVAERLVESTVAGSVAYAQQSDRHLAELRNMVTSPAGTSADAIYQMEKGGLRTVLTDAVWAAYKRAADLSS